MMGASTSRSHIFRAYPTPGLTGSLAAVLVVRTYGDDIQIRITNLTTGTSSTHTTSAAGTPAWQGAISDIPFTAGQENLFDIEIKGDLGEQLDLLGLCVYEDTATHPSSNGTTTYSGL